MYSIFTMRVGLPNGSFADVEIRAESFGQAQQIAEAQFGQGKVYGCISTRKDPRND